MLSFAKLWVLLENRGMKKTDLKQIMSTATIAKLGKNETISSEIIEKLCAFLDCQPSDIMEYISEKDMQKTMEHFDQVNKILMENLKTQGISEEKLATMMKEMLPNIVKSLYNGENTMQNLFNEPSEKE